MKFATKQEYIAATNAAWSTLWELVDGIGLAELERRVRVKGGPSRSIKDTLAHLYSWHRLLLTWYRDGLSGKPDLPAKGFNWAQTRELNQQLHKDLADIPYSSVRRRLKLSHGRIAGLVESLSEDQLLQPGHFDWTKTISLTSYIAPNTVSHYGWATRKIKAIRKSL